MTSITPVQPTISANDVTVASCDDATFDKETKEDPCEHLSRDKPGLETEKEMARSLQEQIVDISAAPCEKQELHTADGFVGNTSTTDGSRNITQTLPQESDLFIDQSGQALSTTSPSKAMITPSPTRCESDNNSHADRGHSEGADKVHQQVDSKLPSKPDNPVAPPTPRRPKDSAGDGVKLVEQTFLSTNRGRVVSLDRGHEALESKRNALREPDRSHPLTSGKPPDGFPDDESSGADTSDGESSYFAKCLPSPKSLRRYSLGSAPAHAAYYQNLSNRESDASLSLSDDSDEDLDSPKSEPKLAQVSPTKNAVSTDVQLFPLQRITRMHSYSSLVSSTSSDEGRQARLPVAGYDRRKANSTGLSPGNSSTSDDSTGTTSDNPSVRDELRSVAAPTIGGIPGLHNETPTGRKSPILGASQPVPPLGRLFAPFSSPGNPQPSPPTILPGYLPPPGMPHPQPQAATSELAAWMAAGNAAANMAQHDGQRIGYGSMMAKSAPTRQAHSFRQNGRYGSNNNPPSQNSAPGGLSGAPQAPFGSQGTASGAAFNRAYSWEEGGVDNRGAPSGTGQEARESMESRTSKIGGDEETSDNEEGVFKVYWQRWLMLFYMSLLNLLSDWTCYSVAPIAMLTQEAFGKIDPEQLVVVFLGANVMATASEPIILARLGLRGTVLLGSLLLMLGSVIKSGGMPPIWGGKLANGQGEWRIELGFFLVGLSQPLYQCTPALLSASWFPGHERTMATGVALNANQLGIGFAFIFGTLLVARKEDILNYFGLLSLLSTLAFLGTFLQFDDAPPTPPSGTAKVMRGTVGLPSVGSLINSVRTFSTRTGFEQEGTGYSDNGDQTATRQNEGHSSREREPGSGSGKSTRREGTVGRRSGRSRKNSNKVEPPQLFRKTSSGVSGSSDGQARQKSPGPSRSTQTANTDSGFRAPMAGRGSSPSSAHRAATRDVGQIIGEFESPAARFGVKAPSPMMPGRVEPRGSLAARDDEFEDNDAENLDQQGIIGAPADAQMAYGLEPPFMGNPYPVQRGQVPIGQYYSNYNYGYWDPRFQHPAYYQYQGYYYYPPQDPSLYQPYPNQAYSQPFPYHPAMYPINAYQAELPVSDFDDGAEPVVTVTDHHLDINIRDDQVLLSARLCLSRPGFVHALVAFTVSGIVINTLSTFMDYLVRLNGASREYVGIVGGSFQFVIMISSLIIGTWTDKTRAYYSVIITMLVLGAFGLAECGVSLNANNGGDVRWILIVVAALVGPLQPVSTELGVDVAYPLSENSVLVIQQLFSNLLSAMFIPIFKSLKDVGTIALDQEEKGERPKYTFSFYLLIVLHTTATIFFASFNGRYFRYEHELEKKAREEQRKLEQSTTAFHPVRDSRLYANQVGDEQHPLIDPNMRH